VAASTAGAALPGTNGRIVFSSDAKIYTVNPDGTFLRQAKRANEDEKRDYKPAWSPDGRWIVTSGAVLNHESDGQTHWSGTNLNVFLSGGLGFVRLATPNQHSSSTPAWSPDGKRFVYASDELGYAGLQSARVDGSDVQHLTAAGFDPAFSPDGKRVVYAAAPPGDFDFELYTMRPDGTDVQKLLSRDGQETQPSWSPDGSSIAFAATAPRVDIPPASFAYPGSNVYVIPAAGGTPVQLTHANVDSAPAWSPDGRSIVFQSNRDYPGTSHEELYVMNADGTGEHRITTMGCFQCDPDWGIAPVLTSPPPPPQHTEPPGRIPPGVIDASLSTSRFRWGAAKRVWLAVILTDRGRVDFTLVKVRPRGSSASRGRRVWRRAHPGANRYRFAGLFKKPLKPGVYRLKIVPAKGAPETIRLRILRRG
jgi:TolB protein